MHVMGRAPIARAMGHFARAMMPSARCGCAVGARTQRGGSQARLGAPWAACMGRRTGPARHGPPWVRRDTERQEAGDWRRQACGSTCAQAGAGRLEVAVVHVALAVVARVPAVEAQPQLPPGTRVARPRVTVRSSCTRVRVTTMRHGLAADMDTPRATRHTRHGLN